jgi:hypothetical protein
MEVSLPRKPKNSRQVQKGRRSGVNGSMIVRPGGQIKVGDIGVVVGEGFDCQHVFVRFQVGEIQLHGQAELRQCVYQDVLNIDRQLKKAEEIRQNRFEDSVKSRNRKEQ